MGIRFFKQCYLQHSLDSLRENLETKQNGNEQQRDNDRATEE